MGFYRKIILYLGVFMLGVSCATAPKPTREMVLKDSKVLFEYACGAKSPGSELRGIKGGLWLKAKSKEASGQFPAQVLAKSQDELDLEITNLLGAPQASLQVRGEHYLLTVENRREGGRYSWGGIPLKWATTLFVGKTPCPSALRQKDMNLKLGEELSLVIDLPAALENEPETFTYHFRMWGDRPWPEKLVWEKKGTVPLRVDFRFEEPEEPSGSPRKWEARSTLGEVKARWKDREALP